MVVRRVRKPLVGGCASCGCMTYNEVDEMNVCDNGDCSSYGMCVDGPLERLYCLYHKTAVDVVYVSLYNEDTASPAPEAVSLP
jgi:hypothetical protein